MDYKIIASFVVFDENHVKEIAVLWQSDDKGSVRATYCTNRAVNGYKYLRVGEPLSMGLLQEVAGYGMNLPDDKKVVYFPGRRKWDK